jgi:hypothetical protein
MAVTPASSSAKRSKRVFICDPCRCVAVASGRRPFDSADFQYVPDSSWNHSTSWPMVISPTARPARLVDRDDFFTSSRGFDHPLQGDDLGLGFGTRCRYVLARPNASKIEIGFRERVHALLVQHLAALPTALLLTGHDLDHRGRDDDCEQNRQKEYDHRDGQLRRQGRCLPLSFAHTHGPLFFREDA